MVRPESNHLQEGSSRGACQTSPEKVSHANGHAVIADLF